MKMKIFEIKNFRSKKFRKFSLKIVWKWKFSRSKIFEIFRKILIFFIFHMFLWDEKNRCFLKIFDLKNFRKFSTYDFDFDLKIFRLKLFRRSFFKIALDFQGGHDGTWIRCANHFLRCVSRNERQPVRLVRYIITF